MAKAKKQAAPAASKDEKEVADADLSPVALCLAKRLRACRKKMRKIEDVEAAAAAGKEINEEQRVLLTTKVGLIAVIDELEKLSAPVKEALVEEVKLVKQSGYDAAMSEFKRKEEARLAREAKEAEEKAAAAAAAAAEEEARRKEEQAAQEKHDKAVVTDPEEPKPDPKAEVKQAINKVVHFLYFAQVCCCVWVCILCMCCLRERKRVWEDRMHDGRGVQGWNARAVQLETLRVAHCLDCCCPLPEDTTVVSKAWQLTSSSDHPARTCIGHITSSCHCCPHASSF